MHAFWIALGIVVLGAGLLDIFLTALNYDEAGFLATPLCVLQWRGLRSITRRLSRRWRPMVLRQITGLQIMLSVATWLGCVIVGYGLIYYGQMTGANFQYDGNGIGSGMFSAFFLSAAQLSTVGTSQITAETNVLRVLTIAETLSGVVLVSLILTFLIAVYQVARDLRTLSANFIAKGSEAGDVISSLRPYFPLGQPAGVDGHLQAISDSFWSYADGVRLHHITYYFQSGRDQFSLPYALHMTVGTIAALRWGLPAGHPASVEPALARLVPQFEQFADYLHDMLGWTSTAVPEVVSFDEFSAAHGGGATVPDIWLSRFLRLNRDMGHLAKIDADSSPREAYERYRLWLPFAYRAEQVTAAVSRDLDYQPVVRSDESERAGASRTKSEPVPDGLLTARTLARPWRVFMNRWVVVPDPGLSRLVAAAGATLAAAAAVLSLDLLFSTVGVPVFPAAMFGGVVAMYTATMPNDTTVRGRKVTTALMVLPAVVAAALGAVLASSFVISGAGLAVIALLGVWIGGFGPRFAALGLMMFMAYYFALLLHPHFGLLPAFIMAAAAGTIWAYLFRFVFMAERPERVLLGGLNAFRARLVLMFDTLIDAVSAARWDPDVRKRVGADVRQLHRCAAFLQGQLRVIDSAAVPLPARPDELRLLVFDTELAATHVKAAAQDIARAGAAVPIVLRGQLAGMLVRAQEQLRRPDPRDASGPFASTLDAGYERPENDARSPESWPENARRLHDTIRELLHANRIMRDAQTAALADQREAASELSIGTNLREAPSHTSSESTSSGVPYPDQEISAPMSRRAVQAAAAAGLALFAGAAVTTDHQYWAALAAFLVLGGTSTIEETMVKGIGRIVGTIAGAVIGFGVATLTGADPFVVLPLLIVCVFAMMYVAPISSALQVFWMTIMLSLLYAFLGTLTTETLQVRVLETVIGATIAFAAATLILPIRTRQKMNDDAVALLKTLRDITEICIERLDGRSDARSLTDQTLILDQRFRQLDRRIEPLRHASGTMGLDGIERRLTATAGLAYYARHLIKASGAVSTGASALSATTSAQLGSITRDNITALIQVLHNELPGPTHEIEDLPLLSDTFPGEQEGSKSLREAALYLVRINQIVLTLIEELTRDIAREARDTRVPFTRVSS